MEWEKTVYTKGMLVKGDETVRPTTRWNRWFLRRFRWRTIVTFTVTEEIAKGWYYIGITTASGESFRTVEHYRELSFSLKVGHEDFQCFVVPFADPGKTPVATVPDLMARSRIIE